MSILNGTHYKESVLAIGTVWTQSIATYHAWDDSIRARSLQGHQVGRKT